MADETGNGNSLVISSATIGQTGLKHFSGYVNEEYHKNLLGRKAVKVYTEMRDANAVVGAILFVIESILEQAEWEIKKGKGKRAARAVELLTEIFADMDHSMSHVIEEGISMLQYGWAYSEVTYKHRPDGTIGIKEINLRAQDTLSNWEIDKTGHTLGMYQTPWNSGETVFIPRGKALHFVTSTKKLNPEGRSVLRSAYRAYYFGQKLEEIQAIGIERDLAGLPIVTLPVEYFGPNVNADQRAVVTNMHGLISKIRRDEAEGVVFPSPKNSQGATTGYDFKLLSTGGGRAINISDPIRRYDTHIAMSLLAQFILLGTDKAGSFALADKQATIFTTSLQHFLNKIADVLNKQLIIPLMLMNGFTVKEIPTFVPKELEDVTLTALATFVNQMVGSNVLTPDDKLEEHLRDYAGLPMADKATQRKKPDNPNGAGRPKAGDVTDRNDANLRRDDPVNPEDPVNIRTTPEDAGDPNV